MLRQKRLIIFLLLGIFSLMAVGLMVGFLPPNFTISILGISLPISPAFFLFLFLSLYFLGSLALRSIIHGMLLGVFAVSYLLMRLNGLTHPFFLLLLFGIFLALELLFVGNRKREPRLKRQD